MTRHARQEQVKTDCTWQVVLVVSEAHPCNTMGSLGQDTRRFVPSHFNLVP